MIGALGLSFVGLLIDRHGSRLVLAGTGLMLGATCLLFPQAGGLAGLYLLFTAQRFFGQGSIPLACNNLVSQWFLRRRGLAISLLGMGGSLGYAVFPPLVYYLIAAWGWQWAFVGLGIFVWVALLPPAVGLVVNKPEDLGLEPDPAHPRAADPSGALHPLPSREVNWTRREAFRTRQFWVLSLGKATHGALVTGLTFHQISLMEGQGVGASIATMALTVSALTRMAAGLAMGPLLDRFPVHLILSAGFALMAMGMAYLVRVDSTTTAFLYAGIIGMAGGTLMTGSAFAMPHYFGRAHLGSIQGPSSTIGILGAALGPIPFGIAFDLLGGYRGAILLQAVLPVILAAAMLINGPPKRRVI
jgi:MFS family permease